MRSLLNALVVLLSHFLLTSSARSTFYGYVSDDTIAYTKIPITTTTQRLSLYVWCEPTTGSESQRQVLIGVNRVPTIANYDSIIALPRNGEIVSIVDESPIDSILYIGIWGGEMLHSYRYFGGSPVYTTVAVIADVVQCDTSAQQGFPCTVYPHIPTLQTSMYLSDSDGGSKRTQETTGQTTVTLTVGSRGMVRRLHLLSGHDRVQLKLRSSVIHLDDVALTQLCNTFAADSNSQETSELAFRIKGDFYLERKPDDVHTVYSDALLNLSNVCSEGMSSSLKFTFQDLVYDLVKPLSGFWTLDVSLHIINVTDSTIVASVVVPSSSDIDGVSTENLDERVQCQFTNIYAFKSYLLEPTEDECRIKQRRNLLFNSLDKSYSYPYATALNFISQTTVIDNLNIDLNVSIETQSVFCAPGFTSSSANLSVISDCVENIHDLNTYSFQDTATFQYSLYSEDYLISIPSSRSDVLFREENVSTSAHRAVMLRGNMEGMTFSPAGGSMSIEVTFRTVGDTVGERDDDVLQWDDFTVYVQPGGVAHEELSEDDVLADDTFLTNRQIILPSNLLQMNPLSAESERTENSQKFRWVYHKPNLADITRPQAADNFMYFYIVVNDTSSSSVVDKERVQYWVKMHVAFSPCLESTCKHGECVVSDDGLLVSSCSCRYPYAGETCDELAETYWVYVFKVMILVLSNFAVFPGAVVAFQKGVPVLGCILTSSGIASIFYHLCDSDIWCIGGLSFQSLQVWDVLFATSSMSAVLIHHYPLHRETRSALSLALLAFLVSPVSNSPTDPICIMLAMGGGAVLFVVFWFRHWLLSRRGQQASCSLSESNAKQYVEITRIESGNSSNSNSSSSSSNSSSNNSKSSSDCGAEEISHCNSSEGLITQNQSADRGDVDVDAHYTSSDRFDAMMGSFIHKEISLRDEIFYDDEEEVHQQAEADESIAIWCKYQHHASCANIFLTVVGFFMVIIAFACYIFQNRETYWIVHSVWHLLAMGSTFLFIKNKDSVVSVISRLLR